jgi:SAM-dependent methyltransferase
VNIVERAHAGFASARRVRVLVDHFARLAPDGASLLDVGCGDGQLTAALGRCRPDLRLRGIDVQVRQDAVIDVGRFDGERIPGADRSYDCVMFVDVLHHAERPAALLAEGVRVARRWILIKDHRLDGALAGATLRFMDRIGNARHGVALPYHYWPESQWRSAWSGLGLRIEHYSRSLGLYPMPLSLVFDRGLHFVARLAVPVA